MGEVMTSQEVFDTVARHLFAQGARSMDVDGTTCMYRGAGGRKCAIGCLIPDSEYHNVYEGAAVRDILVEVPSLKGVPVSLLNALQSAHDLSGNWCSSRAMRGALTGVAKECGLSNAILAGLSFPDPTP